MASKYIRCPLCGKKHNGDEFVPDYQCIGDPFLVECERCGIEFSVVLDHFQTFYEVKA